MSYIEQLEQAYKDAARRPADGVNTGLKMGVVEPVSNGPVHVTPTGGYVLAWVYVPADEVEPQLKEAYELRQMELAQ